MRYCQTVDSMYSEVLTESGQTVQCEVVTDTGQTIQCGGNDGEWAEPTV